MRDFWRDDHAIRLSLLGLSLTLLYLTILLPLGFIQDARSASSDSYLRWRKKILTPPREIQDLLIVTVDDESQRTLNQKWPWDRTVFAEFLQRISAHSPKGVLFDLAFQGTSRPESDNALARAIETAPPTFLAAYLDPKGNLMLPQARFVEAGGIPGLINKPLDSDQRIRRARGIVYLPGQIEPLLAIEARGAALLLGAPQNQIQWEKSVLTLGPRSLPTNWLGQFPINYLASPSDFQTVPFWKILRNSIDSDRIIRGKLVIVGATQEITHDMHPTPLGRLSGIVIEGNVILTLLTGRFVKALPLLATLPLALLFVIGIQQVSYRSPLLAGFLTALLTTGLVIGFGLALSCLDILVEFVSPMVLGSAAWLSGFLYKYLVMASGTRRLQRQAVTDNLTGAFTNRYFQLRLQEELRQFHWARRPASLILVQVASASHLLQHQSWEEVKRFLASLVQAFKGVLPPRSFIGILQEGRFGLFLPNTPLSKAEEIAKKLQGSIASASGISALSLASTEQCPSRAGNALLRCAEAALSQALQGSRMEVYSPPGGDSSPQQAGNETADSAESTNLGLVSSELEERNLALEKALTELRQIHQQLESSFLEVTKTLILALETKDTYTAGHLERVSRYSTRLAEVLQLPKEEAEAIREAALLHDIGKIGLPDEVLHKVGKLTDEEKDTIRQHLSIGARILEPMKFFKSITTLIFHHHEWYNGQGYPHGLAGDLIPAGAQIIAIADAFDAMTTQRSYNKPRTPQEALEELRRGAGTQFNPLYVDKFVEMISQEGPHLAGYTTAA